jgi:nitrate/nitrite transporter NarK
MLITVTSVVATQLSVSYSATTALTGVPLILGALTGLGTQILAQTVGKRGILLGSAMLVLVATLWNMHVGGSYAQFMVSRILEGVGWGAFEGLVGGSIDDLFFVSSWSKFERLMAFLTNTRYMSGKRES